MLRLLLSATNLWAKAIVIPISETADGTKVGLSANSVNEIKYSIYSTLALVVVKEIYGFVKIKLSKTGEKIEIMEKDVAAIKKDVATTTKDMEKLMETLEDLPSMFHRELDREIENIKEHIERVERNIQK